MPLLKKQRDRRLTVRKKKALMKRATAAARKTHREAKKAESLRARMPAHIFRTDEENEKYAEIKRNSVLRKSEHEERLKHLTEVPEYIEKLDRLASSNDVIVEVVDARDPVCSRNPEAEELVLSHGKRCVLVLNYVEFVPREVVEGWKRIFRESGLCCVELSELECDGPRIGIFGGPKAGKYFISKRLGELPGLRVDMSLVSVPPREATLSGLLRETHRPHEVNCISYVDVLLGMVNRDDLCIYYKMPEFKDARGLVDYLRKDVEKAGGSGELQNADIVEILLEPFRQRKVLFWRSTEDKDVFCFRFPGTPL
jgi:nuclear GTP-binding protein